MIAKMIRVCQAVKVYEEDEESVEDIQEVHEEEINNNNSNNNNYGKQNNNNNDENEEDKDNDSDNDDSIPGLQDKTWKTAVTTKTTTAVIMRMLQYKIALLKETENITMMMKTMIVTMKAIEQQYVGNKTIWMTIY
jgi:hypothetical protein